MNGNFGSGHIVSTGITDDTLGSFLSRSSNNLHFGPRIVAQNLGFNITPSDTKSPDTTHRLLSPSRLLLYRGMSKSAV